MNVYRFRSIEKLLKYNELENLEIYFSDIASLNDPMEGYREFYWMGDIIIWKNFLKHYLLCILNTFVIYYIGDKDVTSKDINIFFNIDDPSFIKLKEIYDEMCIRLIENENVALCIKLLSFRKRKISKNELLFYLSIINPIVLNIVFDELYKNKLLKDKVTQYPVRDKIFDVIYEQLHNNKM